MQFSSTLILTAAIFASSAYAYCFDTGQGWNGYQQAARDHISAACTDICNRTYNVDEEFSVCYSTGDQHVRYAYKRVGHRLELPTDECTKDLEDLIDACSQGGTEKWANWQYTLDPNAGRCVHEP